MQAMSTTQQIKPLAVAGFLLLSVNVKAAFPVVSDSYTTGSNGYNGNNLDVRIPLPGELFIGGGYRIYSSYLSNGTISTYKAQVGFTTENDYVRAFGAFTPLVNGYQDSSFGAEGKVRVFHRGDSFGDRGPRVNLLAGLRDTMVTDNAISFNEDDVSGGGGFGFYKTYVKGTFTRSIYDKDITSLSISPTKPTQVDYIPIVLEGYPDYSFTGTLTQSLLSWWDVYVSYAHIHMKVATFNDADALSVGTQLTFFKTLVGSFEYTDYNQPSSGYVSFSLGLKI